MANCLPVAADRPHRLGRQSLAGDEPAGGFAHEAAQRGIGFTEGVKVVADSLTQPEESFAQCAR